KDTVVRHIFRDSALRASFRDQLKQLRVKWKSADSLVKSVNHSIDNTLARTASNQLMISELQADVAALLKTAGVKAFGKERNYIWESRRKRFNAGAPGSRDYNKLIADEKKITQYYFSHTRSQLVMLLLFGIVFFLWIFSNFRSMKRLDKLGALEKLSFRYIKPLPIFASLIFVLNLAP